MLKDIDEDYRTTLIDFSKYKLIMFAMAKLMERETTEQNKVALYLFNNINQEIHYFKVTPNLRFNLQFYVKMGIITL